MIKSINNILIDKLRRKLKQLTYAWIYTIFQNFFHIDLRAPSLEVSDLRLSKSKESKSSHFYSGC